jgi:hypothetical protein
VDRTLSLEEVCKLMHIEVRTGRNRICSGGLMPPGHKPKTTRRWIFFERDVVEWLRSAETKTTSAASAEPRKTGRPRGTGDAVIARVSRDGKGQPR